MNTFKYFVRQQKTINSEISACSTKEFNQLKSIGCVRPGKWHHLENEEFFLSIILEVSRIGEHVQWLEKPAVFRNFKTLRKHIFHLGIPCTNTLGQLLQIHV